MPIDIVLVRHGESESNYANQRYREGAKDVKSPEHLARHTAEYRLTDLGISQAKSAGRWLRDNFDGQFDYCVTSSFARARETAGHLGLPGAVWEIDPYLVERNHGELDKMSDEEKVAYFGDQDVRPFLRNFYLRPPNGESRLDLSLRWDRMMLSLSQRHSEHRVLIVAHETIIECGLIRRLHWSVEQFYEWKQRSDEREKIHNCQIVHFTRRNPETGQVIDKVRWWRSVCPWRLEWGRGEWRNIVPTKYSSADLLEQVARYPRVISGRE